MSKRRIFGLETEYGITFTHRGQRRLTPDEVSRYLFRNVVTWGRSSNVFLENGARLYLDVGSHPEYATPECDSIYDVVAHDRAGEAILDRLAFAAEERLQQEGVKGTVYLFKNNTDSAGNSYGCHENYGCDNRAFRTKFLWQSVNAAYVIFLHIFDDIDEVCCHSKERSPEPHPCWWIHILGNQDG